MSQSNSSPDPFAQYFQSSSRSSFDPETVCKTVTDRWNQSLKQYREQVIDYAVNADSDVLRNSCIKHHQQLRVRSEPWWVDLSQGVACSQFGILCDACKRPVFLSNLLTLPRPGMSQEEVMAYVTQPEALAMIQSNQEELVASAALLYNLHVLDGWMVQRMSEELVPEQYAQDIVSTITTEVDSLLHEADARIVARAQVRGQLSPDEARARWEQIEKTYAAQVNASGVVDAGQCIQHRTELLMGFDKDGQGDYRVRVRCEQCQHVVDTFSPKPAVPPDAAHWTSAQVEAYGDQEATRVMNDAITAFNLHVLDHFATWDAVQTLTPEQVARYRRVSGKPLDLHVVSVLGISQINDPTDHDDHHDSDHANAH